MASSSYLKDFVVKGMIGAGLGIVADALIELSRIPAFNDSGLLGNKNSNYELFAYSIGLAISTISIIDIALNTHPFGISKDALPYSVFFLIGTGIWENSLANMLGFRNINIYDIVESAIPNVRGYLPA